MVFLAFWHPDGSKLMVFLAFWHPDGSRNGGFLHPNGSRNGGFLHPDGSKYRFLADFGTLTGLNTGFLADLAPWHGVWHPGTVYGTPPGMRTLVHSIPSGRGRSGMPRLYPRFGTTTPRRRIPALRRATGATLRFCGQ